MINLFRTKYDLNIKNSKNKNPIKANIISQENISEGVYGIISLLRMKIFSKKATKKIELIQKKFKFKEKNNSTKSINIYNILKKIIPNNVPNVYRLTNKFTILMSNLNNNDQIIISSNNENSELSYFKKTIIIKDMDKLIKEILHITEILSQNKIILHHDSCVLKAKKDEMLNNEHIQPKFLILDYDKVSLSKMNNTKYIMKQNLYSVVEFLDCFAEQYFSDISFDEYKKNKIQNNLLEYGRY